MKIALVVPGGVDRSGTHRVIPVLLWFIERLARRHEVHVFATHQYAERCDYPLLGATVHNLGYMRRVTSPHRWIEFTRAAQRLGPFDVLHAFWGLPCGLLAGMAGRALRIPVVTSLAGGELVALPDIGYGVQLHWRGRWLNKLALTLATQVTVATHYMADLAGRIGVQPRIIPLGAAAQVETKAHATSHVNDITRADRNRLLHVASLNKVKDQTTLLRAMRLMADALPDTSLDIIGEDTLNGAMQRLCRELDLDRHVSFHGFLPSADVAPFFAGADLFVLPSRHDAAPVVVLEAAMRGLPTVGTNVGYMHDWAPERAVAVSVGDFESLATATIALLKDGAKRRFLGQNARAWAEAYNADWTAATFEHMYSHLTSQK